MAVTLIVQDRRGNPYGKVNAFIKWSDGTSNVWVPDSGRATFSTTGTIEYIEIAGKKHYQGRVRDGDVIRITTQY